MPASRSSSMLDVRPGGISLLPGEDHVDLKPDPYFGMVERGEGPSAEKPESPRAFAARLQREVKAGRHALDGDEQNHVEVMTGKRLQQKEAGAREDRPPTELEAPVVDSLDPSTAALGGENFTLSVKGSNFAEGAVIVFNGGDEMTTRVSDTELTTEVNMATAGAAVAVPVAVRNEDDTLSNEMPFTFTEAAGGAARKQEQGRPVGRPKAAGPGEKDLDNKK